MKISKLLCKYNLTFTKEGKEKMEEVFMRTSSFVCFILNEISKGKEITEEESVIKVLNNIC